MPRKSENLIFSIDPVTSEKTNYLQARGAAVEAVNTASDPLEDDNDESPEAALQFIPEEEAPEFSDALKGRMPYIAGGLAVATALFGLGSYSMHNTAPEEADTNEHAVESELEELSGSSLIDVDQEPGDPVEQPGGAPDSDNPVEGEEPPAFLPPAPPEDTPPKSEDGPEEWHGLAPEDDWYLDNHDPYLEGEEPIQHNSYREYEVEDLPVVDTPPINNP